MLMMTYGVIGTPYNVIILGNLVRRRIKIVLISTSAFLLYETNDTTYT